jgi:hypothetical protein
MNKPDKPSLAYLAYALRHREVWPTSFEWDYSTHGTCAMGLVALLWPTSDSSCTADIAIEFNISKDEAKWLFIAAGKSYSLTDEEYKKVQPEHIAELIETEAYKNETVGS